jgi:hypothetical protein
VNLSRESRSKAQSHKAPRSTVGRRRLTGQACLTWGRASRNARGELARASGPRSLRLPVLRVGLRSDAGPQADFAARSERASALPGRARGVSSDQDSGEPEKGANAFRLTSTQHDQAQRACAGRGLPIRLTQTGPDTAQTGGISLIRKRSVVQVHVAPPQTLQVTVIPITVTEVERSG